MNILQNNIDLLNLRKLVNFPRFEKFSIGIFFQSNLFFSVIWEKDYFFVKFGHVFNAFSYKNQEEICFQGQFLWRELFIEFSIGNNSKIFLQEFFLRCFFPMTNLFDQKYFINFFLSESLFFIFLLICLFINYYIKFQS